MIAFYCPKCGKSFATRKELEAHGTAHKMNATQMWQCYLTGCSGTGC
ncbi:MAG: hypothetical protein H3Z53_02425 [archaeon]|nr:hypothetical protein [archaeon]MCP8313215.1 hypothetical protein [archaeon]MCP8316051.1 hypothetical protein [archaeon]MCP8320561.1 hypothetical protein [archaeon]